MLDRVIRKTRDGSLSRLLMVDSLTLLHLKGALESLWGGVEALHNSLQQLLPDVLDSRLFDLLGHWCPPSHEGTTPLRCIVWWLFHEDFAARCLVSMAPKPVWDPLAYGVTLRPLLLEMSPR